MICRVWSGEGVINGDDGHVVNTGTLHVRNAPTFAVDGENHFRNPWGAADIIPTSRLGLVLPAHHI